MSSSHKAIGGYFELELRAEKSILYPDAHYFQSARAAFLALLYTGKPARVWMPRYICDSMLAPLKKAKVECVYYSINQQLEIVDRIDLADKDWLFYVNYFGICTENINKILQRFNPGQVVLDHSQALYAAPKTCVATIYSPRKFFGIPDGGLLITDLPVGTPSAIERGSAERAKYLLKRLADSPESGYADYQRAEHSLSKFEPRQMSPLTRRMLESVDFEGVRKRRNDNFGCLHRVLGSLNQLKINPSDVDGPLCYPFLVDQPGIRERLISERIFVATYWSDALKTVSDSSSEALLVRNMIPLPCDQRYGKYEMKNIIDVCLDLVRK